MSSRLGFCVLLLAFVPGASLVVAQEPQKDAERDLNELSMEVAAFQAIGQFHLTPAQLEKLQKWAKATAQKDRRRDPAKTSKEFRAKLLDLHKALVDNSDDDAIDQLNEALDDLRESEKPQLDDGVDLTDLARQRAAEAFRLLKPAQLAGYLGQVANDIADPFDRLVDALDEVRGLKGAAWKEKRDAIAEEISRLVAGTDADKVEKVSDQVIALLIQARGVSVEEFPKKRDELEKAARKVVGNVSPGDVLRHHTENALAELLSNPRLADVLSIRLK